MMKIIKKLKNSLLKTDLMIIHNFSDYPAEEKTKIIRSAVKESNKMQKELTEKYNRQFAS